MQIQSVNAYTTYSLPAGPQQQRQDLTGAATNPADMVNISPAARDLFTAQSNSAATPGKTATTVFATDQGPKNLNIDDYFTPASSAGSSLSSLPPLLLPNQNNIDALTNHISTVFPQFLAQNNIPAAPSSITYDSNGQIQLPADYAYAAQFKQALTNNPTISRELSAVHALTSHMVEMNKSIPFQQEYAAASTQSAADAVVTKYSYLFSNNHHYDSIALQFSANGNLSLTDDGQPLA